MLKKTIAHIVTLGCSALFGVALSSCNVEEKLPDLGMQVAGATDIVTSPSGRYFYVLNSDYERRFDKGSLLIVDSEAAAGSQKVSAISTPRMGRSLSISQGLLIVSYADPEARELGTVQVWDISNELQPVMLSTSEVHCQPLNAIIAPSTPYAAVTCKGGWVYMIKNPRNTAEAPTTYDLVRGYELEKRAIYFYENGSKVYLFGFPTDLESIDSVDQTLEDSQSYDIATDAMLTTSNGVPDVYESTEAARRRTILAAPYQMFVYPVTDEEEASKGAQDPSVPAYSTFRYIAPGTYLKPSISNKELHFIHYTLLEANGQPSSTEAITAPNYYRFRTNFWEAKIGPENNAAIFYLSQRGDYSSESNNVLRVQINSAALASPNDSKFQDIFTVNRVYGFAIDRDNGGRYPSDFEFSTIGGQSMLFINSFRDLIYFSSAPFYSVTRKMLDEPASTQEVPSSYDSTGHDASFYNIAISQNGKVLTSSFYSNALYLFDGSPSVSIKGQTPISIQ